MYMIQLNDLLPSSQWESYWTFFGEDHYGLPIDTTYVVFEYYCTRPKCDCQAVKAKVMQLGSDGEPINKPLAIIDYELSSNKTRSQPKLAEESQTTTMALHILEVYKKFVDVEEYLERISQQYRKIKQLVSEKESKKPISCFTNLVNSANKSIGRNSKCPCGSGKKYKKCCLQ
jgi:hypothetical protein